MAGDHEGPRRYGSLTDTCHISRRGVERIIHFNFRVTENEVTALTSFAFNLGLGSFWSVPELAKMINADAFSSERPSHWSGWTGARRPSVGRKQVVEGLLNRRRREVALFFGVSLG